MYKLNVNSNPNSCKLSLHQFTRFEYIYCRLVNYVNSVYISVYIKPHYIYICLSTINVYIYRFSLHSLHTFKVFLKNLTCSALLQLSNYVKNCSRLKHFFSVLVLKNLEGFETYPKNRVNYVNWEKWRCKNMTENICDVCGLETKDIVDYYALLCRSCREQHTDKVLLRLIGLLRSTLEKQKSHS